MLFCKNSYSQNVKKNYMVDYKEEGLASYIPDKFNLRESASGEIFDNSQLLGAHPKLPFGTMVKITNFQNKKSIVVRIIDRGPFAYGRMIDISKSAARQIGLIELGSAKVEMHILSMPKNNNYSTSNEETKNPKEIKKSDNTNPNNNTNNNTSTNNSNEKFVIGKIYNTEGKIQVFSNWGVQVASFKNFELAKKHTQNLKTKGLSTSMMYIFVENDTKYCVWYGNFLTKNDADNLKNNILTQYNVAGFVKKMP